MLYLLFKCLESHWLNLTNHTLKIVYENGTMTRIGDQAKGNTTHTKRESITKKRKTFHIRELSSSDKITIDDENTSDDELN